jgi:hypothetical protein
MPSYGPAITNSSFQLCCHENVATRNITIETAQFGLITHCGYSAISRRGLCALRLFRVPFGAFANLLRSIRHPVFLSLRIKNLRTAGRIFMTFAILRFYESHRLQLRRAVYMEAYTRFCERNSGSVYSSEKHKIHSSCSVHFSASSTNFTVCVHFRNHHGFSITLRSCTVSASRLLPVFSLLLCTDNREHTASRCLAPEQF